MKTVLVHYKIKTETGFQLKGIYSTVVEVESLLDLNKMFDFIVSISPLEETSEKPKEVKTKPDSIGGYKINWKAKTISIPQGVQTYCNNIYKEIESSAKELGLNVQLTL